MNENKIYIRDVRDAVMRHAGLRYRVVASIEGLPRSVYVHDHETADIIARAIIALDRQPAPDEAPDEAPGEPPLVPST